MECGGGSGKGREREQVTEREREQVTERERERARERDRERQRERQRKEMARDDSLPHSFIPRSCRRHDNQFS